MQKTPKQEQHARALVRTSKNDAVVATHTHIQKRQRPPAARQSSLVLSSLSSLVVIVPSWGLSREAFYRSFAFLVGVYHRNGRTGGPKRITRAEKGTGTHEAKQSPNLRMRDSKKKTTLRENRLIFVRADNRGRVLRASHVASHPGSSKRIAIKIGECACACSRNRMHAHCYRRKNEAQNAVHKRFLSIVRGPKLNKRKQVTSTLPKK